MANWKNYLGHFLGGGILGASHGIIRIFKAEVIYVIAAIWILSAFLIAIYQNKKQRLESLESKRMKHDYYKMMESTLSLITNILHDRVSLNYEFNTKLQELLEKKFNYQEFIYLITDLNKEKREQVNRIFARICDIYQSDDYLRPEEPEIQSKDKFKVSYYKISKNEKGEEVLVPMYRCYPQEGWPETKEILKGKRGGGSGLAWEKKKIITLELGGEDSKFVELREDQKEEYASMFCYPVKEDVPRYKRDDVIGILTIDSRIRRGYFREKLNEFWAELTDPIAKFLALLYEMDKQKDLLIDALKHVQTI